MGQTADGKRPRRGRPPKQGERPDKPGLGAILSARITDENRAALEAEADRTGRSISQIADRWLDDARKGRAQLHDMAGGDHAVAGAIQKLAEIARTVSENEADPELARVALLAAWRSAISDVVPPASVNPSGLATGMAAYAAWEACDPVWHCLLAADQNDPVAKRASLPPGQFAGAGTEQIKILGAPSLLYELMDQKGRYPGKQTVEALEQLRSAGMTARAEIDAALPVVRSFVETYDAKLKLHDSARRLGKAIAAASTRVGL